MTELKHNKAQKRFEVFVKREKAGLMTYQMSGDDRMIIDHTEVYSQFEGQGLGTKLIDAAVDYARKENLKISPTCSFAKKIFAETPEFRDISSQ